MGLAQLHISKCNPLILVSQPIHSSEPCIQCRVNYKLAFYLCRPFTFSYFFALFDDGFMSPSNPTSTSGSHLPTQHQLIHHIKKLVKISVNLADLALNLNDNSKRINSNRFTYLTKYYLIIIFI